MLIDSSHASQSPPQLVGTNTQSMVSSVSPLTFPNRYDIIERMKRRVDKYREHDEISFQKYQNTAESQTLKMSQETSRLQQQFLNNASHNTSNSKAKQQKSMNASGSARVNNKRSNSSSNNNALNGDVSEAKSTKLAKIAAAVTPRATCNSSAKLNQLSPQTSSSKSYRNSNANIMYHNSSTASNQIDIKPKAIIASTALSQPLLTTNSQSITSPSEIKREVIDNSYFEGVNVDVIRDFLASTSSNNCAPTGVEALNSDIWKDMFNDNFADDGLASANFGDEDFITKFLEEIDRTCLNENVQNYQQTMSNGPYKQQQQMQTINHCNNSVGDNNISLNINANTNNALNVNSTLNTGNINRNNQFSTLSNDTVAYHPIQPRLQSNTIINIPHRMQNINSNQTHSTFIANMIPNTRNFGPNSMQLQQQSALVLQPTSTMQTQPHQQQQQQQQHTLNNIQLQHQQQQHAPHQQISILQQQHHNQPQPSQSVQLRLSSNTVSNMVSVMPKTESNVSLQLSIQVPPQVPQQQHINQVPAQPQSTQPSSASIKLKQMAQAKTHQWVINHANISQSAVQPQTQQLLVAPHSHPHQPLSQPQPQTPNLPQATQVRNSLQQQHQTQQHFYASQPSAHIYWQQQQPHQPQQPQQQQAQPQQQHHPSQTQPQPNSIHAQSANQQQYQIYWAHNSHVQTVPPTPTSPPQQQQTHYFSNNCNNNYF